ncbi:MAG: hypothetical protein IJK40_06145 [Clostridia bacterium]|nr:hypothetical protein [Clostridia bacterium]
MMLLSDLPVGGLYILGILLSLICAFALMGLIHAAGKKEVRIWFLASSLVFAVCFAILYGIEWKLFCGGRTTGAFRLCRADPSFAGVCGGCSNGCLRPLDNSGDFYAAPPFTERSVGAIRDRRAG